jgi:hypothetical protein
MKNMQCVCENAYPVMLPMVQEKIQDAFRTPLCDEKAYNPHDKVIN